MTEKTEQLAAVDTDHDDIAQRQSRRRWLIGGIGFLVAAIIALIALFVVNQDADDAIDDQASTADAIVPNVAESHGEDARMSMVNPPEQDENIHEPLNVPEDVIVDAAGYTMKELGESGQLTAAVEDAAAEDEDPVYSITVDDIRIEDTCMLRAFEIATQPEGEHFIMVDVTATVADDIAPYIEGPVEDYYMPLTHDAFALADADGDRIEGYTETARGCLSLDERPDDFIDAGESTTGTMVFDVEELPERLAYDPDYAGGWSWEIPVS